jgi:phenylalanyl-tRNA synthetase beta chain
MLELTGARLVDGTVDVGGPGPEAKTIRLRDAKVTGLLGIEVPISDQADLLERLDFGVVDEGDGLDVTVPYFRRNDVTREVDLIEEVARLWGLEKLPITLPSRHDASGRLEPEQRLRRRAADALVGTGFSEAVGWSFQAPEMARRLRIPHVAAVHVRNPLSEDLSEMRTTLLGSLLDAVRHNRARGAEDVRLFEQGTIYLDRPHGREPTAAEQRSTPLPDEQTHLAALMTGRVRPASWLDPEPPTADFFTAKGALTVVLAALRVPWGVERTEEPFLHPGRAARVLVGGEPAGWLGELHPGVAGEWDLGRTAGFELDFGVVLPHAVIAPLYEDLTSYPSIRQDLAFWTDRSADELLRVVRDAGGKLLRAADVFDVYTREGETSLALRLEFRASDRTLTDEEIAPVREKIVAAVAEKLGGRLRA